MTNKKKNKKKSTSVVRSNVNKSPQASQAKMNETTSVPANQVTCWPISVGLSINYYCCLKVRQMLRFR